MPTRLRRRFPRATIDPNRVVTQLSYDADGDVASSATPDGNSGSELSKTTNSYDADGELLATVSPDGNVSGADAANYTTTCAYDADGEVTSITQGAAGDTVVPRQASYTFDPNGNLVSSARSDSIERVGVASGGDEGGRRTDLALPPGTEPGDLAVLAVSTSVSNESDYTVPSGFSLVGTYESGPDSWDDFVTVYTHVITGAETTSDGDAEIAVSFDDYFGKMAFLGVYRGVDSSDPIDVASSGSSSGSSITIPSVTTTTAGDELVSVATEVNQNGVIATWSAPSAMTEETGYESSEWLSGGFADGAGPRPRIKRHQDRNERSKRNHGRGPPRLATRHDHDGDLQLRRRQRTDLGHQRHRRDDDLCLRRRRQPDLGDEPVTYPPDRIDDKRRSRLDRRLHDLVPVWHSAWRRGGLGGDDGLREFGECADELCLGRSL